MGYGIAPNKSHFTGKKTGRTRKHAKKLKIKRQHRNKYSSG